MAKFTDGLAPALSKLKTFVEKTLNAKGTWTSPGGDVKLFKDDDSDLIIKGRTI
jgi:hypothetical protein